MSKNMTRPANAMEVFTHLDKSNCRECGEKTCLAFAAAVFQARKQMSQCSKADAAVIERFDSSESIPMHDEITDQITEYLEKAVSQIDLKEAASRIGGEYDGQKMSLRMLGKRCTIDAGGRLQTDIHINPYVVSPLIEYMLSSEGGEPAGDWVSFRELKAGRLFSYAFFQKRCEHVMKSIADSYPDLFEDMVTLFNAEKVPAQFASDVSVILHPLPKVPIMICYWMEEEGMDSTLNVFFDRTADVNLPEEPLFTLCVGLALMLERISQHHTA